MNRPQRHSAGDLRSAPGCTGEGVSSRPRLGAHDDFALHPLVARAAKNAAAKGVRSRTGSHKFNHHFLALLFARWQPGRKALGIEP
jgi:hypothetical protein